jgi:predicted Zn finger-like uncharacterized protein
MTQMVTRCPKCATAFRITSAQLESAKGAVRCGSCLHIFKADDYLIDKTPSAQSTQSSSTKPDTTQATTRKEQTPAAKISDTQKSSASKPTTAPTKNLASAHAATKTALLKRQLLDDDDDMLISDDMDKLVNKDSDYAMDSFLDINLQPKQSGSLFDREIRYEPHVEKQHIDESWADQLLDDDNDGHHSSKNTRSAPKIQTQTANLSRPKEAEKTPPKNTPKAAPEQPKTPQNTAPKSTVPKNPAPKNTAPKNAPVFSLINENHHDQDSHEFSELFVNATRGNPITQITDETYTRDLAVFSESLFDQNEESSATEHSKKSLKTPPRTGSGFNSRAALLMNIMPAPIEFNTKRMRNWYHKKLWSNLVVLTSIVLFFQITYFKFDYFSRVEPYRTAYTFICPVLGCKVPTLVDRTQISAYNLVVRNHPEAKNALIVDAIILNKAPFPQPFPDIVLAFSTIDETPVASRRFTPKEYLGGELAGMDHIPIKQPVHITLELADPGPTAVNYHMGIAQ